MNLTIHLPCVDAWAADCCLKVTEPILVSITIKSQLQISVGGLHDPAILLLFSRKSEFPFFPTTISLTPFAPHSQKTICCRHCRFVLVDEILILFQRHEITFELSQWFLTGVMWIFKGTQRLSKEIWVSFSTLIHLKMPYWSSVLTSLWQLSFFGFIEEIHALRLFKILLWGIVQWCKLWCSKSRDISKYYQKSFL